MDLVPYLAALSALAGLGLAAYFSAMVTKESPTLFRNDVNRHISQIVSTRVATTASPWLRGFRPGELHSIAVSHGEGKFVVSEELARGDLDSLETRGRFLEMKYKDGDPA